MNLWTCSEFRNTSSETRFGARSTTVDQLLHSAQEAKKIPIKLDHGSGVSSLIGHIDNFRQEGKKLVGMQSKLKTMAFNFALPMDTTTRQQKEGEIEKMQVALTGAAAVEGIRTITGGVEVSMTTRERKLHDLLTRAIVLLHDSDAPSEDVSAISRAQEDLELLSTITMNRKYVIADNDALALRFDAHHSEIEHVINTGILRRCNSWGVPAYRACDVAEARFAISGTEPPDSRPHRRESLHHSHECSSAGTSQGREIT